MLSAVSHELHNVHMPNSINIIHKLNKIMIFLTAGNAFVKFLDCQELYRTPTEISA